ncbi:Chitin deacetylase [Mucor velutinosus]|uniref:Chitin deacetylase n=1 Tax=Mucor velutinosus TaxID=708070 RepID=A0AAN7D4A4_9FUNG|nr:Chitin deacetylase [Mucor velutinosus]
MSDSAEEEVFEVEEIQAHKFVKKNKEVLYFIKWLNYSPEDNTWEKEANVFATDLIEKYWNAMPPTSKDRRQFEKINNSRKNPIKLTFPATIPTVTPAEATSSTESSANIAKNSKQQQTLDSVFGVYNGKGKEKEAEAPQQPAAAPAAPVARLPQVIATNNNEDDDMDEDEDEEEEKMEIDDTDDEDAFATPTPSSEPSEPSNSASDNQTSLKKKEEAPKEASTKRTAGNDSSRQQEDYFLKQHEKKRKREELGISDDSSVESLSPPLKSRKTVVDIEEIQEDEEVIFNEKYAIDPPLDWTTQTERVEYIGKEVDQSDLYCLVRWKDGVKSMHPLNLVREKRPDLVIDRFVQMVMQQQ